MDHCVSCKMSSVRLSKCNKIEIASNELRGGFNRFNFVQGIRPGSGKSSNSKRDLQIKTPLKLATL